MLHRHHLVRRLMISFVRRARAVHDQTALEASIIALPHRRVHTNVRRDATQQQRSSTGRPQYHLQIRRMKTTFAAFVDDVLVR